MSVTLAANLRVRGRQAEKLVVISVSRHGCAVQPGDAFHPGDLVWLKLPRIESWAGTIRWVEEGRAGLMFDRPLHEAVVDRLAIMGS